RRDGEVALPQAVAALHQVEQPAQALAEERAISSFIGRERYQLQIAQALEAVAEPERVALHRHDTELRAARFDVKEEEQAIQVGDALAGELAHVELLVVGLSLLYLEAVTDGFVPE